ncbi:MAG: toxin ParE1/3/4 [Planctomycetota bacterium]|jgi:toxin ParE1/3/4
MAKYYLSEAAIEDLISIAQYGDDQFGVAQSDQYREKFKRRFSVLAESPELFATVDHIRVGYRRSVCGVHSIYYRIEGQDVEIVRVLGR